MSHKIGIYVRVSTEEQAQVIDGSIDNQQHRLKAFIDFKIAQEKSWGKLVESYIDDGFSAKDTRRPAYQRMMKDLKAGKINLILVTDISRLSRNIHDFCILLKELEKQKSKFLSIKEQFDTSTPAGEMMIYNMINLAQFERKQTSERVSMNFHSRAMRGLLNGSAAILGYDKDPTNTGKFIVNEEESVWVRKIFEMYLKMGSTFKIAKELNLNGIKPKAASRKFIANIDHHKWNANSVHSLLRSLHYIGKREVNKANKNEDQEQLKPWHRYQVVDASWPGIVSEDVFYQVQKLLEETHLKDAKRTKNSEKRFFLLSGVIKCKECGKSLIGEAAHGKNLVHRYYSHKRIPGVDMKCSNKRVRANDIEDAIINHLDKVLLKAGYLDIVEMNIKNSLKVQRKDFMAIKISIDGQISQLSTEIDQVFKLQLGMASESAGSTLIREKLDELANRRNLLIQQKEQIVHDLQIEQEISDAKSYIEDNALMFKKGFKKSTPIVQRRLFQRLFSSIYLTPVGGLEAFYHLSENDGPNGQKQNELVEADKKSASTFVSQLDPEIFLKSGRSDMYPVASSLGIRSGGPYRTRICDLYHVKVAL
jgi:site-specific DNA recombinase